MRQLYCPLWKTGLYSFVCFSFPNPSIAIVRHRHAFMRAHTYQWAHEYTCMHMCVHVRMLLSVLQL